MYTENVLSLVYPDVPVRQSPFKPGSTGVRSIINF